MKWEEITKTKTGDFIPFLQETELFGKRVRYRVQNNENVYIGKLIHFFNIDAKVFVGFEEVVFKEKEEKIEKYLVYYPLEQIIFMSFSEEEYNE